MADLRFEGWIAGLGSTSGARVVVGCWVSSPYGPSAATYAFDEVQLVPVTVEPRTGQGTVRVLAGGLDLTLLVGRRTSLGRLLRLVPGALAGQLWWVSVLDRPARTLLRGVRTVGSAGGGRREWYAATDNRSVSLVAGTWQGTDLGRLADVAPPVRFGFGSTPARPSWTRVTTTVRLPAG